MAEASIRWIAGPVLRARTKSEFHIHDVVEVGEKRLQGEVIQLAGDEIVAQIYEDTTGIRPGEIVSGTGQPLSVRTGASIPVHAISRGGTAGRSRQHPGVDHGHRS
jgi:V/A-type H+-transporting ATPase subunit A